MIQVCTPTSATNCTCPAGQEEINGQCEAFNWVQGGFGACSSNTCGVNGNQTQRVECRVDGSPSGQLASNENLCPQPKPPVTQVCTPPADTCNSPFIFTVRIPQGDLSYTLSLPAQNYNFSVNWGDGTSEQVVLNRNSNITHIYPTAAEYEISIVGVFPHIKADSGSPTNASKIIDVIQWGNNPWGSMEDMFNNASNITSFSATDTPNLSRVESMHAMFADASQFNSYLSSWNTSNVTDMSEMFSLAKQFNNGESDRLSTAPLNWNTSNVNNMSYMFSDASAFQQNIGSWNTSRVTDMSSMFQYTDEFNQDIGSWNTSNVTDMSRMFYGSEKFNRSLCSWDVSQVTNSEFFSTYSALNILNTPSKFGGYCSGVPGVQ